MFQLVTRSKSFPKHFKIKFRTKLTCTLRSLRVSEYKLIPVQYNYTLEVSVFSFFPIRLIFSTSTRKQKLVAITNLTGIKQTDKGEWKTISHLFVKYVRHKVCN